MRMTTIKLTVMNSTDDDANNNIERVEYFGILNDIEVIVQEMDLLPVL